MARVWIGGTHGARGAPGASIRAYFRPVSNCLRARARKACETALFARAREGGGKLPSYGYGKLARPSFQPEHIDAFVMEGDPDDAELWEIDENFARAELTDAQRADHHARRRRILIAKGIVAAHGGDRRARSQNEILKSYTEEAASALGVSKATVSRDLACGRVAPSTGAENGPYPRARVRDAGRNPFLWTRKTRPPSAAGRSSPACGVVVCFHPPPLFSDAENSPRIVSHCSLQGRGRHSFPRLFRGRINCAVSTRARACAYWSQNPLLPLPKIPFHGGRKCAARPIAFPLRD